MASVDIVGSGQSWQVRLDGKPVDTPTNSYEKACIKALKVERQLQTHDRTCISCDTTFTAQGRGNRMCPPCLTFAAGAMV